MRCPVHRAKIKASKKEHFTACGEESTYQGTYSGVSFRSVSEIPLLSLEEKKNILFQSTVQSPAPPPAEWKERHGEDVPLFWNESKPIAFWQALLDDWSIQAVFDVTPGSGALMEASLTRGAVYHGVCLQLSLSFFSFTETLTIVADFFCCSQLSQYSDQRYLDSLRHTAYNKELSCLFIPCPC